MSTRVHFLGRIVIVIILHALHPAAVWAERGAWTVAAGGGVSVMHVSASNVAADPVTGTSAAAQLELRYSLTHALEVELAGALDLPATYYHGGATLQSTGEAGTLIHRLTGLSAFAGVRLGLGMIWRPIILGGVGVVHRSYSAFGFAAKDGTAYAADITSMSSDHLAATAGVGLEWLGDHLSVSIVPRAVVLAGSREWAVTVPAVVAWSVYR